MRGVKTTSLQPHSKFTVKYALLRYLFMDPSLAGWRKWHESYRLCLGATWQLRVAYPFQAQFQTHCMRSSRIPVLISIRVLYIADRARFWKDWLYGKFSVSSSWSVRGCRLVYAKALVSKIWLQAIRRKHTGLRAYVYRATTMRSDATVCMIIKRWRAGCPHVLVSNGLVAHDYELWHGAG
jgi:hypothetical protein